MVVQVTDSLCTSRSSIRTWAAGHRCLPAFLLVAVGVILSAVAAPATAQVLTWDPNGASAGTGGDGSWNTTSLFWTGTSGTRAWASGTAGVLLDAYFGGTSGTVTVTTPLSFNDIRFDSNYVLTGSALSVGPQGGTTVFTVNSGVTAEIQNVLVFPTVGFMTWNKRGLGTLILSGNSGAGGTHNASFEGTTILKSGTYGANGRVQWTIASGSVPGSFLQTGGLLYGSNLAGSNGWGLQVGSTQYGFYGLSGGRLTVDNTYGGNMAVLANSAVYVSGTSNISFSASTGGPWAVSGVMYATGGTAALIGNNR